MDPETVDASRDAAIPRPRPTRRRVDWRAEWPGLLGVLGVVVLLGWPQLRPGTSVPGDFLSQVAPWSALVPGPPANELLGDPAVVIYPFRKFVNEELQRGRVPLWNPYVFAGQPVTGEPDMALFYPTTLILGWLPPASAFDLHILIHLLVAALGLYVLARTWGGGRLAGVLGAAVFCGSSGMALWRYHGNLPAVGAWLPWLLVSFDLSLHRRAAPWMGAAGLVLGLIVTANFVQWALYDLFLLGSYAVWLSASARWHREPQPWRPLWHAAVVVLIGLAIGAIQLLPLAELAASSTRSDPMSFSELQDRTLPALQLVTMLAPDFFGTPVRPGTWWGLENYVESTIYWGIYPLILAATAPLWARGRRVWFLWIFMLIAASLMIGWPTLYLFVWLPGFNLLKHDRLIYVVCFCGALLCALGLDRVLSAERRVRNAITVGALAILACGALWIGETTLVPSDHVEVARDAARWATVLVALGLVPLLVYTMSPRWSRAMPAALAALIIVDVAGFSLAFAPRSMNAAALFPLPRALEAIESSVVPPRVAAIDVAEEPFFMPNTLMTVGLAELGGYSSLVRDDVRRFLRTLNLRRPRALQLTVDNASSPLLDLAGVDYVLSPRRLDVGKGRLEPLSAADGVWVYRNLRAAPRAFIVSRAVRASPRQERRRLEAPDFFYCEIATLDIAPPDRLPESAAEGCVGVATIREYECNRVRVLTDAPSAGLLILTDAYYPGWRATVDGVEQPIHRTDGLFRGVFLPAGAHDVVFTFRPPRVMVGAGLSLAGLVVAGLMLGTSVRPRRRH